MDAYNITVVGGAGIVGREFLKLLDEPQRARCAAAPARDRALRREAGRVPRPERSRSKRHPRPASRPDDDIVFLSASGSASKQYAPIAQANGSFVVDDSSAYRMDPDVPLVIPEINAEDLDWHKGIVSQPNCTTTPMVMALEPDPPGEPAEADHREHLPGGCRRGRRPRSMACATEAAAALEGRHEPSGTQKREIAFNAVPQIDLFAEDGYTKEEIKMANETRKILHAPDIAISATCVRIPTFFGHAMTVWAEFERPVTPAEARELIGDGAGRDA